MHVRGCSNFVVRPNSMHAGRSPKLAVDNGPWLQQSHHLTMWDLCMQVCTIGFGLVDKGPWLQKSHDLVMLAGGRTLRPTSEGYLRTEQGPRLRHIHLLDVDSHLQGIRHSMTWDTLSPHCGPVASAMLPLLLWPVSLLVTQLVSSQPSTLLRPCLMSGARQALVCLTVLWVDSVALSMPAQNGLCHA